MLDPTRWDLLASYYFGYIHILVKRNFSLFAELLTWNIWFSEVDQIWGENLWNAPNLGADYLKTATQHRILGHVSFFSEDYCDVCHTGTDPQAAASTMAMQYASVRDVLRKMCPRVRTLRTCECSRLPSRVTRSCSPQRSRTSSRSQRLGPSPPIRKCNCGKYPHVTTCGITVIVMQ